MVLRCFWEFDLSHSVWTWADRVISALDQTWLWMGACWNHPETCNTTQEWWEARSNPDVWFQLISTDFNLSQTSKNQPTSNIHQTANRNNFKPPQGHQAALDPGLCVSSSCCVVSKNSCPPGQDGRFHHPDESCCGFLQGPLKSHWRAIEVAHRHQEYSQMFKGKSLAVLTSVLVRDSGRCGKPTRKTRRGTHGAGKELGWIVG